MVWSDISRQRGLSGSGWFMVVVLVFGTSSVLLRIIPHYLQHNTVDGQILALLDNPDIANLSDEQVHSRMETMLKRNNVRDFETKEKLSIERGPGAVKMDLSYEVRESLFWNIDVILTFEEHYEKVL